MKVSIALATYNGAKYLQAQLDSFLAQTRPPDELVATDDASNDATWTLLNRFQRDAPFDVRLSRNIETLGYKNNFARTLALTTGDVIFLSDQDDYWLPEKLERMLSAFEQRPDVLVVTCDQALADANLRLTGQTSMGQLRAVGGVAGDMFTVGCCTALRASARDLMLPLPTSVHSHDIWLHFVGEYLGRRVVPEVLQFHRRHGENTSVYGFDPTRRPSIRAQIQQRWHAPAAAALTFRRHYLHLLSDRLSAVAPDAAVSVTSALERIGEERTVIAERLAIARRRRILRLGLVARLLRKGGYRRFSGWKSAGFDLLRPRASDA